MTKKKRPFKTYTNGKTKSRGGKPPKHRGKNTKVMPYVVERSDIFKNSRN